MTSKNQQGYELPQKPKVTIALPVYNGAATLKGAIQSVLNQSFSDWELIILDDASKDQSLVVMRSIDDPRIRLVEGDKNLGLSARLNMAIDMARGKYFARMDQDDLCFPERVQKQFDYLQAHPEIDLVASATLIFKGDGEAVGCLPVQRRHEQVCTRPWSGFHLPHPTWMGKTDWFRRYGYDSKADGAEDQQLLLRAYKESRYACIDEVLLAYREVRSLKKMLKARKIFARAYILQFIGEGSYSMALQVMIVSMIKATADILNLLFGVVGMRNRLRPLFPEEQLVWQKVWGEFECSEIKKKRW